MRTYALVQFALAIVATLVLLWSGERLALVERLGLALAIAWTVAGVGLLFDRRPVAMSSELLRLALCWAAGAAWAARALTGVAFGLALAGSLALSALFGAWLLHSRRALTAD